MNNVEQLLNKYRLKGPSPMLRDAVLNRVEMRGGRRRSFKVTLLQYACVAVLLLCAAAGSEWMDGRLLRAELDLARKDAEVPVFTVREKDFLEFARGRNFLAGENIHR